MSPVQLQSVEADPSSSPTSATPPARSRPRLESEYRSGKGRGRSRPEKAEVGVLPMSPVQLQSVEADPSNALLVPHLRYRSAPKQRRPGQRSESESEYQSGRGPSRGRSPRPSEGAAAHVARPAAQRGGRPLERPTGAAPPQQSRWGRGRSPAHPEGEPGPEVGVDGVPPLTRQLHVGPPFPVVRSPLVPRPRVFAFILLWPRCQGGLRRPPASWAQNSLLPFWLHCPGSRSHGGYSDLRAVVAI
mmetsp:Transcript_16291/g.28157  ORF Transcript_16291/g.28157 Transcript_16291/m.28157 type:complete len:245 (-) Transcript_16291:714-1448(-)